MKRRICIIGARSAGEIGPHHTCAQLGVHSHVSTQRAKKMLDAGEAEYVEGTGILRHVTEADTRDHDLRPRISRSDVGLQRQPGGPPNGFTVWQLV